MRRVEAECGQYTRVRSASTSDSQLFPLTRGRTLNSGDEHAWKDCKIFTFFEGLALKGQLTAFSWRLLSFDEFHE